MPQLFEQLTKEDGWTRFRTSKSVIRAKNVLEFGEDHQNIHFVFQGKALCGAKIPEDAVRDNVPEEQCRKCFERHRNLFNSSNVEDAYKDL